MRREVHIPVERRATSFTFQLVLRVQQGALKRSGLTVLVQVDKHQDAKVSEKCGDYDEDER